MGRGDILFYLLKGTLPTHSSYDLSQDRPVIRHKNLINQNKLHFSSLAFDIVVGWVLLETTYELQWVFLGIGDQNKRALSSDS